MSNLFIHPPVFVSAAEYAAQHPSGTWKNPFHMHKHTELVFIREGKGEFIVAERTYSLKKGDAIVHYPLIEHQEAALQNTAFRAISVQFNELEIAGKPKDRLLADDNVPVFHLQDCFEKVDTFLAEILSEYREERTNHIEINSSLLQTLILVLLRSGTAAKGSSESTAANKIKTYIEQNYFVELTLNDLADIVYISPYHLAHLFKEEVGVSPIQYLIKCRIAEAKRLLEHTDLAISEISAAVGYPNANYFNVLFKKVMGMSPGKYRKRRG